MRHRSMKSFICPDLISELKEEYQGFDHKAYRPGVYIHAYRPIYVYTTSVLDGPQRAIVSGLNA